MVERVDLGEVLAAVAGGDLVAVHLERQPFLVLRRDQLDAPQRQKAAADERHDPQQHDAPRGERQRAVEEAMRWREAWRAWSRPPDGYGLTAR